MRRLVSIIVLVLLAVAQDATAQAVRMKDIGRFQGGAETAIVGYGVVMGLAGSGDSPHNEVTQQALRNVLSRFGANVVVDQVRSRNVAAVMVTATVPPTSKAGDHLDVSVASIGDARSLLGGALLATPLIGPDGHTYAVAQGPVVVGGYRFDADHNVEQKNHPTAGLVPGGAAVASDVAPAGAPGLLFVLADADMTTAGRVAEALNQALGSGLASIRDAKSVAIRASGDPAETYRLITRAENLTIQPDAPARVVVNERSGTVVAGGGVQISSVVISQGDVKVSVQVEHSASQPLVAGGYAPDARSLLVSNTKLAVSEPHDAVVSFPNTTVNDLVQGLQKVNVRTRAMIAILQAMRAAGALHAEIVVE